MKKIIPYLIVVIISMFFSESLSAQKYAKMKITLTNGTIVDGRKGLMQKDNVKLLVSGTSTGYSLDEVNLIMDKKGKEGKYAVGFGGGCLAICLLAVAVNPDDADVGTLLLGSAIWTMIFAGIGAGIGAIADPWNSIYIRNQRSSILDRLDLSFSSNKINFFPVMASKSP